MSELTIEQRLAIIKRRDYRDDITGKKHPAKVLEIHHKNRNTKDNRGSNLRVLTIEQHQDLHKRAGR
jgi:hypothetical protein